MCVHISELKGKCVAGHKHIGHAGDSLTLQGGVGVSLSPKLIHGNKTRLVAIAISASHNKSGGGHSEGYGSMVITEVS